MTGVFPALRRKRVGGFWNDLGQRCGFSALPGYRLSMMALMQATRKLQSFNAVNQLRILGRWMQLITIPNQSSVAKAWNEFDEDGRMKPSPFYNRIVDVMEELYRFTLLTRDVKDVLVDRYSERVESHAELSDRVKTTKAT